jgi:hypothetical protein
LAAFGAILLGAVYRTRGHVGDAYQMNPKNREKLLDLNRRSFENFGSRVGHFDRKESQ